MNIQIPDSWLKEFLETKATPFEIARFLSLCGPSVEKVTKTGNDIIYDIEITTNRIDSVSVEGVAREAGAILPRFGIPAKFKPKVKTQVNHVNGSLPIEIIDSDRLCKRIMGIVLDNISVEKSDELISSRLEKCGVRSLNNIVDITNYVMLELGHPIHVFDYDRIGTGKLVIRTAKTGEKMGEKLKTLDGKTYALDNEDVIIDDGTGRIIDLPGIMGTQNSVVTKDTKRILVFIESNDPVKIRKTSLRLGIRTLAATINEKNPDIETTEKVFLQAVNYYITMYGAHPASRLVDIVNSKPLSVKIKTTVDFINKRIGVKLNEKEIIEILKSLEFTIDNEEEELIISPPFFRRNDISLPVDIVEEIARIYGYHKLPANLMTGNIPLNEIDQLLVLLHNIKLMFKYWGYTEIYNYSLISEDLIKKSGVSLQNHLKLENPLTKELEYLRISLIPSVLESVYKNQNNRDLLNIFELAKTYIKRKNGLPLEEYYLCIANNHDFYKLKGTVEAMLEELGINGLVNTMGTTEFFHPKKILEYVSNGESIIKLGAVHPVLQNSFSVKNEVFMAEVNLNKLSGLVKYVKNFTPLPLFPPIYEDITVTSNNALKLGILISDIQSAHDLVKNVELKEKFGSSVTLKITFGSLRKNIDSKDLAPAKEKIKKVIKSHNLQIKGNY